jgi:cell division transport system permease protein
MTLVSIVTIAVTLFLAGCIALAFINIQIWLKDAARKASFVAYIKDPVAQDSLKVDTLVRTIKKLRGVNVVTVVTKQVAWNTFKNQYGSAMLEAVEQNPFPASLEISLKEDLLYVSKPDSLKRAIEKLPGIEEVQFAYEWLGFLRKIQNIFIWITLILVPILIIALHAMIANTIKLTIYARKDIITNMRYVGATDFYIKTPFILEGMLQGSLGALVASIGIFILKVVLLHFSFFWGAWYFLPVVFIVIGVVFGCIGSMNAVRKFLV